MRSLIAFTGTYPGKAHHPTTFDKSSHYYDYLRVVNYPQKPTTFILQCSQKRGKFMQRCILQGHSTRLVFSVRQ